VDRSSAPGTVANRTDARRVETIAALRRLRFTGAEIAQCLGMAVSTVSGILTRIGMGKLGRLGLEPPLRYERQRPGELIHVDVKKLGRIHQGAGHRVTGTRSRYTGSRTDAEGVRRQTAGWEYVHIDDATRLAYVEVLDDQKATTAVGFLRRAVKHFHSHGITLERLITDNGSPLPLNSPRYRLPRTRGSATSGPGPTDHRPTARIERFIRTMLGGWAYGAIYRDSAERNAALPAWIDFCNRQRPHGALSHKPPIARPNDLNNPLRSYT
jgi:hypothetical protein